MIAFIHNLDDRYFSFLNVPTLKLRLITILSTDQPFCWHNKKLSCLCQILRSVNPCKLLITLANYLLNKFIFVAVLNLQWGWGSLTMAYYIFYIYIYINIYIYIYIYIFIFSKPYWSLEPNLKNQMTIKQMYQAFIIVNYNEKPSILWFSNTFWSPQKYSRKTTFQTVFIKTSNQGKFLASFNCQYPFWRNVCQERAIP